MQGPNKPVSDQLIREAKIGLTIVALLAGLFCYVAWNRFSGNWNQTPEHVALAPIAKNMNKEFREAHRVEMASRTQTPINSSANSALTAIAQDDGRSFPSNGPIEQTFTQGKSIDSADSVANSRQNANSKLPITVNDLRGQVTPTPAKAKEIQPAAFMDYGSSKSTDFDDPFGPAKAKNSSQVENPSLAPREPFRLSPQEASQFKPTKSVEPLPQNNSSPNENTSPPENLNNSSQNSGAFQPRAVTHRSSFQVQVIDDREQDTSSSQSQASTTNPPQIAAIGPREHRPLTRAQDFATHSLHPPRPMKNQVEKPDDLNIEKSVEPITITSTKDQYTVQNTDETLWSVAQEVYGDGRLFRALYQINQAKIPDPEKLNVGSQLNTPPLEQLVLQQVEHVPSDLLPEVPAEQVHVTEKGDTLFDIARQRLGQASRFNELIELNLDRLPRDINHLSPLTAGMRISLPKQ